VDLGHADTAHVVSGKIFHSYPEYSSLLFSICIIVYLIRQQEFHGTMQHVGARQPVAGKIRQPCISSLIYIKVFELQKYYSQSDSSAQRGHVPSVPK
jgi:hypothetical protein